MQMWCSGQLPPVNRKFAARSRLPCVTRSARSACCEVNPIAIKASSEPASPGTNPPPLLPLPLLPLPDMGRLAAAGSPAFMLPSLCRVDDLSTAAPDVAAPAAACAATTLPSLLASAARSTTAAEMVGALPVPASPPFCVQPKAAAMAPCWLLPPPRCAPAAAAACFLPEPAAAAGCEAGRFRVPIPLFPFGVAASLAAAAASAAAAVPGLLSSAAGPEARAAAAAGLRLKKSSTVLGAVKAFFRAAGCTCVTGSARSSSMGQRRPHNRPRVQWPQHAGRRLEGRKARPQQASHAAHGLTQAPCHSAPAAHVLLRAEHSHHLRQQVGRVAHACTQTHTHAHGWAVTQQQKSQSARTAGAIQQRRLERA